MNKIQGSNWFSTLDVKSAYWQLRLHENTKPLTAFTVPPNYHYEYNSLPLGLKQAPGIFQEFMNKQLKGLDDICSVYIDDIIIFTPGSRKDHLLAVIKIIDRCREKGIILSRPKAIIAKKEIDFLGLTISNGELKLQPHIVEKLNKFPDQLADKKQLQRFLGNLNYISDQGFLKNLAQLRRNLQKKLSDKIIWSWSEKDTENVIALKKSCQNLPALYNPKEKDLLIISTDASGEYWAAVMTALPFEILETYKQEKGKDLIEEPISTLTTLFKTKQFVSLERVSKYISGTFTDTQKRYTTHERETLALLNTVRKWKIELLPKPFIVKTDSKYVTTFIRNKINTHYNQGRLIRWQLELAYYEFQVILIKSEENYGADTLTREWSQL